MISLTANVKVGTNVKVTGYLIIKRDFFHNYKHPYRGTNDRGA
jgi:hypothetical protein